MIFIVADDLTGANDSAIQFTKNGFATYVAITANDLDQNQISDYGAVAINTDTRALPPAGAFAAVHQLVKEQRAAFPDADYYKKIDSLFRGNPVQEIEAVMDAGAFHLAYVVPAFPEGNRSMKHGKIVNLGQTIDVADLFDKESIKKIGHVAIEEVREGKEHLLAFVEELKCKGCQIILFDGESNADLETVHSVFEEAKQDVLLCGSAGIASYIKNQSDQSQPIQSPDVREGMLLYAIGSRSQVTAKQVSQLMKERSDISVAILNAEEIKQGDAAKEVARVLDELFQEDLKEECLLVLDSLFEESAFDLKVTAEMESAAKKIMKAIGDIAVQINAKKPISKIIATGGDTALEICKTFGASGIILKQEILPGIPYGEIVGGGLDGAVIATKSGGFGEEQALIDIRNFFLNKPKEVIKWQSIN